MKILIVLANGNEGNLILFLGNVYHFRNKWYSGSTMLLTLTRFRWKNESFVCLGRERKCSFTKMTNWNVQINGLSNTLCTRLTIKVIKLTKLREISNDSFVLFLQQMESFVIQRLMILKVDRLYIFLVPGIMGLNF